MDVTRHDTDFTLTWLDDTWAVRSDETCFVLGLHDGFDLDHIESGDSFSDADNEVHLSFNSFQDGISSERGRNIDDGSVGISGSLGFSDRAVDGESKMLRTGLALVNTTNDLSAISKSLFSVESTLNTSKLLVIRNTDSKLMVIIMKRNINRKNKDLSRYISI